MCLALAQRTQADFQVGPARLDGDEHLRLLELGLGRITGSEALLLLGLAEQGAELARDALAKPADASLRMLPGARHCESRCVPTRVHHAGGCKPLIFQNCYWIDP